VCGSTVFGAGPVGAGGGVTGLAAEGFTTTVGFAALGVGATGGFTGAAGLGGAGAGSVVCLRIALNTSPGFEILERSIFVLMPPGSVAAGVVFADLGFSSPPAKCLRTRSARSGSSELEWLFLSSTPMVGR
jgi:hypothetical protein